MNTIQTKIISVYYSPVNYKSETRNVTNPSLPSVVSKRQSSSISSHYYPPVSMTFKGQWFEDNYIKKVTDKEYQGTGLYKDGIWVDFNKVGWKNLSKEPLDWSTADETEFYVFQHANALAETNDTTWVKRFNKYNVKKPLATSHSIDSREVKEPPAKNLYEKPTDDISFATNLKELMNLSRHKSLDVPITDKNGKLCIDCVVFDTETTGTNTDDTTKPLDKIIQIGAIQVKNGKVLPETGYSQLINPKMHIPEGSSAVHGLYDNDVKDAPVMEEVLKPFVNNYLNKKNGIIVAYNSKFDIKMLNNAINEHNEFSNEQLKPKRAYKVIDPFILQQRIHPYLGARKKLSEQYKFLFCKNLDDAHDAFADVKGTVDVLKYDLYYLSEKRKDKSKPLTIRDVLLFQNGVVPPNLDIKLDHQGCNADVNFRTSYRLESVNVDNYFTGYKITKEGLNKIKDEIGERNVNKLIDGDLIDEKIDLKNNSGYSQNPAETRITNKTGGVENAFYVMKNNFMKVLDFAGIEGYKDKPKDVVKYIIAENSKQYINEDSVDLWVKNPNPKDIKDGNDLPVFEISKRVMNEHNND